MTTQTRQLFGTDGIRGVAGEFPLTQDSTYMIGRALGHDLKRSSGSRTRRDRAGHAAIQRVDCGPGDARTDRRAELKSTAPA